MSAQNWLPFVAGWRNLLGMCSAPFIICRNGQCYYFSAVAFSYKLLQYMSDWSSLSNVGVFSCFLNWNFLQFCLFVTYLYVVCILYFWGCFCRWLFASFKLFDGINLLPYQKVKPSFLLLISIIGVFLWSCITKQSKFKHI